MRGAVRCVVLCVFLHNFGEIDGGVGQKVQLSESAKNPLVEGAGDQVEFLGKVREPNKSDEVKEEGDTIKPFKGYGCPLNLV